MQDAAVVGASAASLALGAWVVLGITGAGARLLDRLAAATFVLLAVTSLCLFRVVVVEATQTSGPLPFFVFLGVPLGGVLGWLCWRIAGLR
jgi:hypothetical protein